MFADLARVRNPLSQSNHDKRVTGCSSRRQAEQQIAKQYDTSATMSRILADRRALQGNLAVR